MWVGIFLLFRHRVVFWRVGDESDDDDSDDLHNSDVVNVCVKKGKENYMHVVEI